MATYLGSLVQLCCGEGGTLKTMLLACVGSAHGGCTTLGLPHPKAACTSWVHTVQAPDCSARALSHVGPAFRARPRSKSLRFSGVPQGHRSRWAVCFVPFFRPCCSGDQALGERSVPGQPCVLCTSLVLTTQFPGCTTRAQSQVCLLSPLGR